MNNHTVTLETVQIISNTPSGECIGVESNGNQITIDPFVGCAYEYKNREQLLGNWYMIKGSWYNKSVFLVDEGGMKLLGNYVYS